MLAIMDDLSPSSFFDLKGFPHPFLFADCKYVWEALKRIEIFLKNLTLGKIEVGIVKGVYLIHPELISIGKGTVVEPGAYITGPCLIGENCQIRHGAYIRGNVVVGDKCVVGHDTEIKNSVMLTESSAAHFAYLGDTILGRRVNLGAGTKCANLRLDHHPIKIHWKDQTIDTGIKKFGAIIGDNSQLGCNSVTNPGTLIGKNVLIDPLLNPRGVIPSRSRVKAAQELLITNF